jgi:cell division protease FtsH
MDPNGPRSHAERLRDRGGIHVRVIDQHDTRALTRRQRSKGIGDHQPVVGSGGRIGHRRLVRVRRSEQRETKIRAQVRARQVDRDLEDEVARVIDRDHVVPALEETSEGLLREVLAGRGVTSHECRRPGHSREIRPEEGVEVLRCIVGDGVVGTGEDLFGGSHLLTYAPQGRSVYARHGIAIREGDLDPVVGIGRGSIRTMDEDVSGFASLFQRFLQQMTEAGGEQGPSALRGLIDAHLGTESEGLAIVAGAFLPFDHANVQIALMHYLSQDGATHENLGLSGQARHYGSFADLLEMGRHAGVRVGKPDLVDLAIGPDDTIACVQFGVFLIARGEDRFAILMRGPDEQGSNQAVLLEVLASDPSAARKFLAEMRRLIGELNVFRGQVLSFGESQFGHMAVGPIVFYRRPSLSRDQLVLAEGVLDAIELEVLGIGEHKHRLLEAGQHVKRGVLLHGPPGTGKTHTVRYLVSRASEATVLLLTGGGLHMIRQACALARMLQPSIVVLEDIDLIAQDRGMAGHYGNPLLFDVLNEMDGMAEDADVAFVLTTNRADVLEPALAARPGRVDLAVEIALPDADARRGLLQLYGAGLELELHDPEAIVARTSGVTAAFIKELVRKSALLAASRSGEGTAISVSDEHVVESLDELLAERSALTRVLLGGHLDGEQQLTGPRDWLLAE